MFPGDWFTFYRHLHNGTFPRQLPSELRDVGGEKLQGEFVHDLVNEYIHVNYCTNGDGCRWGREGGKWELEGRNEEENGEKGGERGRKWEGEARRRDKNSPVPLPPHPPPPPVTHHRIVWCS